MSEVSISLSGMAATASRDACSSVISFLVFAILVRLPLRSSSLSRADDAARHIVVIGPGVDDEQKNRAGLAQGIPAVAVGMRIMPGQGQWIRERDLANAQRQLMPAAVDGVFVWVPSPPQRSSAWSAT